MTTAQADEIVRKAGFAEMVEDHEFIDGLHVYTLDDGTNLIVESDGSYYVTNGQPE